MQDSLVPLGGSEIVAVQTIDALAEAGCTPAVICRERDPTVARGIPVYERPELFRPSGRSDPAVLETIVDQERPDLIHIHKVTRPDVIRFATERLPTIVTIHDHNVYCPGGSKVFWRTGIVCTRPLGVPCLIHAYTHHCAPRHPVRLWARFTTSADGIAALRTARRVLAHSGYVREQLVHSGLEADHIRVLAPWVELPPTAAPDKSETVLFAGRITPEKGLPNLLRALALLRVPFKAVIAGDGPLRRSCEGLASRLGLDHLVEFRGWLSRSALREEYAQCGLLALPSVWPEPFGLVGPEVMAYGKPVVAFDVGGVREWLVEGVNGLLVRRGEVADLARAIARLLTNSKLRVQLGEAARTCIRERFDRKLILDRLIGNYHELLN